MSAVATPPKFQTYKPHPLLALFPAPTENDICMMEHDVKEHGVTNEIVLWSHPNGNIFLIDGRTRQEAAHRAFDKKVEAGEEPKATNGVDLQPATFDFDGSPDEVYRYISKTHIRKNYSPAQKAAMVVKQHYYEYKQIHGNRLPSLDDEMSKDGAVSPEELARRAGVNIHYIRVCRRLYRDRPDLLDAVSAGVTAVGDADRMSKQAQATDGAPEEAPKPPADETEEVIRDAQRNEVPKNLEDVFRSVSSFRVMEQYLADSINAAEKIAGSDAATWFDAESFIAAVKGCQKMAKEARPHIMCADCAGKGRQRYAREDCPRCKGSGFVSKGFLKAERKAAGKPEEKETEE